MENSKIMPKLPEGCSYGEFGHKIYQDESGDWFYTEDNTSASIKKPCPKCNLLPMKNGNAPCLGKLPGIVGACGHGLEAQQGLFENVIRIKLKNAEIIIPFIADEKE